MLKNYKSDSSSIYNYLSLDGRIATGGQPDEDEIRELAKRGFSAVINLGLTDTEYALLDEVTLVTNLGLDYFHIPVAWETPKPADFYEFVEYMTKIGNSRLFVHCAANKRVSVFMALYNILYCDRGYVAAIRDIEKIWRPNEVWQDFMGKILNLEKPELK